MLYRELTLTQPEGLNARLYARFTELSATDRVRRTHHFAGRFENTYIDVADIPDMGLLLDTVKQQAGQMLGIPVERLKAGFWFNAMEAGHRTTLHHHDENDELLSAVYYIRVPENSGELVLHAADGQVVVEPREGKLVMFAPCVPHEVTTHHGTGLRLAVAMNIGPADNGYKIRPRSPTTS